MRDILAELRLANLRRNVKWDPKNHLTGLLGKMFFSLELGGEVGEALNKVKKLIREDLGIKGSRTTKEELGFELADIVICCDLLANQYEIDLREYIPKKHNLSSDKIGLEHFMKEFTE